MGLFSNSERKKKKLRELESLIREGKITLNDFKEGQEALAIAKLAYYGACELKNSICLRNDETIVNVYDGKKLSLYCTAEGFLLLFNDEKMSKSPRIKVSLEDYVGVYNALCDYVYGRFLKRFFYDKIKKDKNEKWIKDIERIINKSNDNKSVSKSNSNISQRNTSVVKNEFNNTKSNSSVVKSESNGIRTSSNVVKRETNVIKSDSNVVKRETNVVKRETNAIKSDSNIAKNNSIFIKDNSITFEDNSVIFKDNSIIFEDSYKVTSIGSNTIMITLPSTVKLKVDIDKGILNFFNEGITSCRKLIESKNSTVVITGNYLIYVNENGSIQISNSKTLKDLASIKMDDTVVLYNEYCGTKYGEDLKNFFNVNIRRAKELN